MSWQPAGSVSYTHLDVYKRQVCYCVFGEVIINNEDVFALMHEAVSYTHLDVYKRQVYYILKNQI